MLFASLLYPKYDVNKLILQNTEHALHCRVPCFLVYLFILPNRLQARAQVEIRVQVDALLLFRAPLQRRGNISRRVQMP